MNKRSQEFVHLKNHIFEWRTVQSADTQDILVNGYGLHALHREDNKQDAHKE